MCLPSLISWNLNLQCNNVKRWGGDQVRRALSHAWLMLSLREWGHSQENGFVIKVTVAGSFTLSWMQNKGPARGESSVMDFLASREKYISLIYNFPSVRYSVTAAQNGPKQPLRHYYSFSFFFPRENTVGFPRSYTTNRMHRLTRESSQTPANIF